jgi:hypothetical protein
MVISAASSVLGYAIVYFVFFSKSEPQPEPEQPAATQPAEPVVLAQVVDVTDLGPLLDPPPTQPTGVPFDPTEPLEPPVRVNAGPPAAVPAPTPPAEVAPMPHEVGARPVPDSWGSARSAIK